MKKYYVCIRDQKEFQVIKADKVDIHDGSLYFTLNGEIIAYFREWSYWMLDEDEE